MSKTLTKKYSLYELVEVNLRGRPGAGELALYSNRTTAVVVDFLGLDDNFDYVIEYVKMNGTPTRANVLEADLSRLPQEHPGQPDRAAGVKKHRYVLSQCGVAQVPHLCADLEDQGFDVLTIAIITAAGPGGQTVLFASVAARIERATPPTIFEQDAEADSQRKILVAKPGGL